ncbi:hypothetical protein SRDD_35850 [Serratia sp. DD3]|nr:hypothetical protein SRDD_35850 [Serratia sp. DD3]
MPIYHRLNHQRDDEIGEAMTKIITITSARSQ